jgi:hypothetical protein
LPYDTFFNVNGKATVWPNPCLSLLLPLVFVKKEKKCMIYFLQSFILGEERVGSCVIRYNLDEYMHSVCFLFWMVFFCHCLALYVCCVLDKENSKDSFIHSFNHSFSVLWVLWGTNCYVTMIWVNKNCSARGSFTYLTILFPLSSLDDDKKVPWAIFLLHPTKTISFRFF